METFRFFHISDLHFSEKYEGWQNPIVNSNQDLKVKVMAGYHHGMKLMQPSTYNIEPAIAAYQHIIQRTDQADALIVTGDLATTGSDEDLVAARDYFLGNDGVVWNPKTRPNNFSAFIGSELDIVMMPGNHDRYQDIGNLYWPGNKAFEQYFENNWCIASKQNELNITGVGSLNAINRVCFTKNKEKVMLYCIDLTLRTSKDCVDNKLTSHLGQGYAYDDIIDDVKADIKAFKAENMLIVWAVHFSPSSKDDLLKLYNSDKLLTAAQEMGVSILLCGHVHTQCAYNKNNIEIICAGTVCSAEYEDGDGNMFWDIEFDVESGEISNLQMNPLEFDLDLGFM